MTAVTSGCVLPSPLSISPECGEIVYKTQGREFLNAVGNIEFICKEVIEKYRKEYNKQLKKALTCAKNSKEEIKCAMKMFKDDKLEIISMELDLLKNVPKGPKKGFTSDDTMDLFTTQTNANMNQYTTIQNAEIDCEITVPQYL